MSRKIVYNTNSMSQDQAVLIDDSSMSQDNGYWRFGHLIPDGNKKSNFRTFISIAIFVTVFLLGYLTCHLMSPVTGTHVILSDCNAHLNNTKTIIHDNETNLNTTSNTLETVTKTTSNSATESNIHTTNENSNSIITQSTVTTVSPGTVTTVIPRTVRTVTRRLTTATSVTETSTVTATEEPRDDMISCLKDFTNRFEEMSGNKTDKCVNEPISKKSSILFIPTNTMLFDCLINKDKKCDTHFHNYKDMDIRYSNLKHIRYNFVTGDHGNLYEGRPLSCSFDDAKHSYLRYNNSQIIIGMPACHKLDSEKLWEKFQFFSVVKNLIYCLNEEDILSETFTMQFDKKCKHYLAFDFNLRFRDHLKFFNENEEEYDDYY